MARKKKKKKVKAVKKKIEKKVSLTVKSSSADQKVEIKKIKKQGTKVLFRKSLFKKEIKIIKQKDRAA